MLDFNTMAARLELENIEAIMSQNMRLWNHAMATFTAPEGELFPKPTKPQAVTELARIQRRVRSVGAEALRVKRTAAIGSVESAEETTKASVRTLAESLFNSFFVNGATAAFAYTRESDGESLIESLQGYLMPYFDAEDQRLTGLYQAKVVKDKSGKQCYWVRVFDFEDEPNDTCTLRVWRELNKPTALGSPADAVYENVQRPVIVHEQPDDDGRIISRMLEQMPMFEDIYTVDVLIKRSEMFAGFPIPVIKGSLVDTDKLSFTSASPLILDSDGSFEWSQPGNLDALRTSRADSMAQLKNALNLPSSFQSQAVASGVSIREFNTGFIQDAQTDAARVEKVVNEAGEALQSITGRTWEPVVVTANLEYIREQQLSFVLEWTREGIIPRSEAMKVAKLYLPSWDDDDFTQALGDAESAANPQDILDSFGDEA